jgi:hypothetical protein
MSGTGIQSGRWGFESPDGALRPKPRLGKGCALLALGVALALASAGCVGAPGGPDDDGEDIADAVQQLDSVDGSGSDGDGEAADGDQDGEDGAPGSDIEEEGGVEPGEESEDPQPVPWRPVSTSDSDPDPDPTHMPQGSSSTPSNGTGGK